MKAEEILSRLEGVKRNGKTRWVARCPAHEDRSPSLSIGEAEDGRVLIHCFAGCGAAEVMSALGLSLTDLFDKPLYHHAKPMVQKTKTRGWHESMVAIGVSAIKRGEKVSRDELAKIKESLSWLKNHPVTEDWLI